MKPISLHRLIYLIITFITFTIFYQQVFVINVGASLKFYEILSILLVILYLIDHKKIYSKYSLYFFFLMVLTPLISYIFYLLDDDKYLYYKQFPEALNSFRTNLLIAPTLLLVYYIFNWVTVNYIIASERIYINKNKIIRLFIISASIVSIYNFYAFIFVRFLGFPDLIPPFLDFRNAPTHISGRFSGFSDEPGSYILLQGWVVLYLLFYSKELNFKNIKFLRILNIASLVMTMSSLIIPAFLIYIVYKFKKAKSTLKFRLVTIFAILVFGSMQLVTYLGIDNMVKYIIYEKAKNYVEAPNHTLDSGSFRSYTTRLGIEVFKENPIIGSGGGTSCFYLWKHDDKMGIKVYGEKLSSTTYPQNCYSKILAELGITGFSFLILFLIATLRDSYKLSKKNKLCEVSFWGTLFTMASMIAIYPETSLFLWFNIALAINEIYHHKKQQLRIKQNEKYINC